MAASSPKSPESNRCKFTQISPFQCTFLGESRVQKFPGGPNTNNTNHTTVVYNIYIYIYCNVYIYILYIIHIQTTKSLHFPPVSSRKPSLHCGILSLQPPSRSACKDSMVALPADTKCLSTGSTSSWTVIPDTVFFFGRAVKLHQTHPSRWAPTSYKWSYNLYKWPYIWVTGVITLLIGGITPFITDRGPPCWDTITARYRKEDGIEIGLIKMANFW